MGSRLQWISIFWLNLNLMDQVFIAGHNIVWINRICFTRQFNAPMQVKNILVTGHSCCGGIRALMSMNDEADSRYCLIKQNLAGGKWFLTDYDDSWQMHQLTWSFFLPFFLFLVSFIKSWVTVGKNARLITEAATSDLSFDLKCKHCEKVHNAFLVFCQDLDTHCFDLTDEVKLAFFMDMFI